ncbi:MAG TPA: hypothetical protein VK183_08785 [Flavobacterium sp.]|nr:hypothetical protein [Flavobacterium sp.]
MKKATVLIALSLTLLSCKSILTRILLSKTQVHFDHYKSGHRDLVFIDATHVGKPEYFADIKFTLDSLRGQGYTVVFEEIRAVVSSLDDLPKIDLYKKKIRKITGVYFGDYSDAKDDENLNVPNMKGLTHQTVDNTGIDRRRDIWADYTLFQLVKKYEAERGEIELSECDLQTPPHKRYRCAKINRSESNYLLVEMRNKRLLHVVDSIQKDKVAILYGSRHHYDFIRLLREKDSSWTYQKRQGYY